MNVDFSKMQSDIEGLIKKVDDLTQNIKMMLGSDGYMSLVKGAEYLDISQSTLRRYKNEIPHFQRDRLIIFKKSDLDTWIVRYQIK
ncbi:MAG: helix-turn-helix domain-containing protein [Saprospiraceae bacterium]|nr:helix-turn-helix domain-containing protein [Saprospiraceae bacterium]MBK6664943.1 helix-turn-helix domain-containing protein [Saprospiraceae bacterium]HQV66061.1 helix-turn-helix domain-containing protein [Saprospiraceae bacterium]